MSSSKYSLSFLALAAALAVTACGGGGGGGGVDNQNPSSPVPAPATSVPANSTLPAMTYAADSAKAAIFQEINAYRTKCGFPALRQNTILDKAAQNHADYMIANGRTVTDTETRGNPGFTGITGLDRAIAQGWPAAIGVGAANAGATWTNAILTQEQYGQSIVTAWASGVYHQGVIATAGALLGVGVAQAQLNGFPQILGGVEYAYDAPTPSNITTPGNVLTFPCQGTTNVPFKSMGEIPAPPATNGAFGTPITVSGNPGDRVIVTAATLIAAGSGTVIDLHVLNSGTDPERIVQSFQSVAYPTSPLQPNTVYSVAISGSINGTPFSRSFTFTTGNTVG